LLSGLLIIFLKKDKNDWLFFVIGNIGYIVSIFFTAQLKDASLIIPLLVYAVIVSVVYQIMYWRNENLKNIQNVINVVSLLILEYIMLSIFKKSDEVIVVGIVSIIFGFVGLVMYTVFDIFHFKR